MKVVLTGKPGCSLCQQLENVVKKIGVEYTKVDLMTLGGAEAFSFLMEKGVRSPANIIVGQSIFTVSEANPAKIPQVLEFLKETGID